MNLQAHLLFSPRLGPTQKDQVSTSQSTTTDSTKGQITSEKEQTRPNTNCAHI